MMNELTTKQKDNVITVQRTFDAPRELVFDVHTNCKHLEKWYGGEQWPLAKCDMDFRVGGTWNYCFSDPEGGLMCARAEYREIERPEKITYLEHFLDENGSINHEFPAGLITYNFIDRNGKTEIINRWEYPSKEETDMMLQMGAVEGLTEVWERLDTYLKMLTH
jgi:uncharacterized protein YndB with AHSA1/START domain